MNDDATAPAAPAAPAVQAVPEPAAPAAAAVAAASGAPAPDPAQAERRNWFKHAVFYELLVRAFSDSNDDGVGDFPGLTNRLDYLQWLGVDCI